MTRFLRRDLQAFQSYKVAPISHRTVINANESPFNIMEDEGFYDDFVARLSDFCPMVYPDPNAEKLKEKIAKHVLLSPDHLIIGNGGDEIISLVCQAFLEADDLAIAHDITFDMYRQSAVLAKGRFQEVPNLSNYVIDVDALIETANRQKAKIVFLCRPNNPTGYIVPKEEVERLLQSIGGLVVLDEAYIEFSDDSLSSWVTEWDNLLVIRTLSKAFSIAGLRVGYGIGCPDLIEDMNKVKPPYNMNGISQLFAETVLDHGALLDKTRSTIVTARTKLVETIKTILGVRVHDSTTNFILIEVDHCEKVLAAFDDASILVKSYGNRRGLSNCIRLTITTEEVNDRIVEVLKRSVP